MQYAPMSTDGHEFLKKLYSNDKTSSSPGQGSLLQFSTTIFPFSPLGQSLPPNWGNCSTIRVLYRFPPLHDLSQVVQLDHVILQSTKRAMKYDVFDSSAIHTGWCWWSDSWVGLRLIWVITLPAGLLGFWLNGQSKWADWWNLKI